MKADISYSEWQTIWVVAGILGRSPNTIRKWVVEGLLEGRHMKRPIGGRPTLHVVPNDAIRVHNERGSRHRGDQA